MPVIRGGPRVRQDARHPGRDIANSALHVGGRIVDLLTGRQWTASGASARWVQVRPPVDSAPSYEWPSCESRSTIAHSDMGPGHVAIALASYWSTVGHLRATQQTGHARRRQRAGGGDTLECGCAACRRGPRRNTIDVDWYRGRAISTTCDGQYLVMLGHALARNAYADRLWRHEHPDPGEPPVT